MVPSNPKENTPTAPYDSVRPLLTLLKNTHFICYVNGKKSVEINIIFHRKNGASKQNTFTKIVFIQNL
jgi:hypothetical protein